MKIHWPFLTIQISDKFKDCLLPSAIAFTADIHFSYLHINCAPKAVNVFTAGIFVFIFFNPEVKNLKLSICYERPFANFIDIANI